MNALDIEILTLVAHGYRRQEVADKMGYSIGWISDCLGHRIFPDLNASTSAQAVYEAMKEGLIE